MSSRADRDADPEAAFEAPVQNSHEYNAVMQMFEHLSETGAISDITAVFDAHIDELGPPFDALSGEDLTHALFEMLAEY
jgi:hypothetical protein